MSNHLQVPREFGHYSSIIYNGFIVPMHRDNEALTEALVRLVEACEPILKEGSTPGKRKAVKAILLDVETCRWTSTS